jgi:hypothetical protein
MKKVYVFGMAALLCASLFVMGCGGAGEGGDGDGSSDPFAGTWEGSGTLVYFNESGEWILDAQNGAFQVYLTNPQVAARNLCIGRGAYTYSGNTVTLTITQTLTWWWNSSTYQITDQRWENSGAQITVNIIGDAITTGGVRFTKTRVPGAGPDGGNSIVGTWTSTGTVGAQETWVFKSNGAFESWLSTASTHHTGTYTFTGTTLTITDDDGSYPPISVSFSNGGNTMTWTLPDYNSMTLTRVSG